MVNKALTVLLSIVMVISLFGNLPATATAAVHNVGPRANTVADPANGIYVSPNGNDATANGSISKPYQSINTALGAAAAGSTVILRGGKYFEHNNVRIQKPNITIKSAKGEWAVIDLPLAHDPDSSKQTSAVRFDVDGPGSSGSKLQGVEVIGGYYALCMETKWDWGKPDRSGVSNIIIEDCILHDSRNDVVKVKPNCDNITIRYNEIYNSGRTFAGRSDFNTGENNSEGIDNVNGDNMKVQNNYIHDICSTGVYAKGGATNALVENNRIERTYAAGIMVGFDTSPGFFDLTVNPEYYENIDSVVRNNLVIDAGWEGIGLYASKNAQVYNNTVVNAVCGVKKYHSPIYFGVATQDWDNPGGCPPSMNPVIHHNIVVQPSSYTGRIIDIRFVEDFYDPGDYPSLLSYDLSALDGMPAMNNNCYYIAGKSAYFSDNRPSSPLTNAGLTAWKSHIIGDSGSVEVDPALKSDFMTSNPECEGMGIQFPLIVTGNGKYLPAPTKSQFAYSLNAKVYNGKAQGVTVKPNNGVGKVTAIYYNGSKTKPKKIGSYKVKVDAAAGTDYTAAKGLPLGTFKIIPSSTSVTGIRVGAKQMKVKWKKVSAKQKITKYQIRYRVKGTANWKIRSFAATASSATIISLKKGKVYQVQVRSYKKISGVKHGSKWSSLKISKKIK